jgi:hypothetical protein
MNMVLRLAIPASRRYVGAALAARSKIGLVDSEKDVTAQAIRPPRRQFSLIVILREQDTSRLNMPVTLEK